MRTVDDVIRECGDTIDDVAHEVIRLRDRIRELEAQQAASDTQRIDWLSSARSSCLFWDRGINSLVTSTYDGASDVRVTKSAKAKTIREAIDAAMGTAASEEAA